MVRWCRLEIWNLDNPAIIKLDHQNGWQMESESLSKQTSVCQNKSVKINPPEWTLPFLKRIPNMWQRRKEKIHTSATNVILHPLKRVSWRRIWNSTQGKNRSNATSVTLWLFKQAFWGHIWKSIQEKNHTNATNTIMHLLEQMNWGNIKRLTPEKSHTNATYATMHLLKQVNWGCIQTLTLEKNCSNVTNVTIPHICHFFYTSKIFGELNLHRKNA